MLRPYQEQAIDAIVKAYDKGIRRQLMSMATGTGKTVIFSNLFERMKERLPGQYWVVAHREELIDQAVRHIRHWNPSLLVDKEMAEYQANPLADIIVSSIASIGRKNTKRVERFDWDNVSAVIVDEAHHSIASTYQNFLQLTKVLEPDSKKLLLGVTATPQRGDGKELAKLYQEIVYNYPLRMAIEDGWLVDLKGFRVNTKLSLDEVKTTAGDFQVDMLADAVNNPARNALVVKSWLEKAPGLQTVVFTVNIQHAVDLAKAFAEAGIKAQAIWGSDPDRALKLAEHKGGVTTVLCNCGVLTEGYDDWRIRCIVLARPTKSGTLYAQMVGRGTRLEEGTGNLLEALLASKKVKSDCIIIDVCDATFKHRLQTVPTLLGLRDDIDLEGQTAVKAIKALERAQEENPHIDFSKLKKLSELKTYIESVNLFDVTLPVEIETHSSLMWHTTADGGYALIWADKDQKDKDKLFVKQNMLDKWDIFGVIHGQKYRGVRDTFEEALKAADDLVASKAQNALKILGQHEEWHEHPATLPQKKLLRKLYRGRQFPFCACDDTVAPISGARCASCKAMNTLSKGHASRLIIASDMSKRVSV